MEQTTSSPADRTIDECVRAVTAFTGFEDLKATEPSYAPTFYPRRGESPADLLAMRRVAGAFNAYAARAGRNRRSVVLAPSDVVVPKQPALGVCL